MTPLGATLQRSSHEHPNMIIMPTQNPGTPDAMQKWLWLVALAVMIVTAVVYAIAMNPSSLKVASTTDNDNLDRDGCIRNRCYLCVDADDVRGQSCDTESPEYACYTEAVCERQEDGLCGFTVTDEIKSCLASGVLIACQGTGQKCLNDDACCSEQCAQGGDGPSQGIGSCAPFTFPSMDFCISRPACLDSKPACSIPEPLRGWCPSCGNGQCDEDLGETEQHCPQDCQTEPCLSDGDCGTYNCVLPVVAGDDTGDGEEEESVGHGFVYSPSVLIVNQGDSVEWKGNFTLHPLISEDDLWNTPLSGTSFTHTFNTVGTYPFFCGNHGGPGGEGMSGVIIVLPRGTAPTTHSILFGEAKDIVDEEEAPLGTCGCRERPACLNDHVHRCALAETPDMCVCGNQQCEKGERQSCPQDCANDDDGLTCDVCSEIGLPYLCQGGFTGEQFCDTEPSLQGADYTCKACPDSTPVPTPDSCIPPPDCACPNGVNDPVCDIYIDPDVFCACPSIPTDPCDTCQAQREQYYCTDYSDPSEPPSSYCSDRDIGGDERYCRKCSTPTPTPPTCVPPPSCACPRHIGDPVCDVYLDPDVFCACQPPKPLSCDSCMEQGQPYFCEGGIIGRPFCSSFNQTTQADPGEVIADGVTCTSCDLHPMCDYPSPPAGCQHVPGPNYDPETNCGMVLECSDSALCADDIKQCPDGSVVSRDPANNYAFFPCPDVALSCRTCQERGLDYTCSGGLGGEQFCSHFDVGPSPSVAGDPTIVYDGPRCEPCRPGLENSVHLEINKIRVGEDFVDGRRPRLVALRLTDATDVTTLTGRDGEGRVKRVRFQYGQVGTDDEGQRETTEITFGVRTGDDSEMMPGTYLFAGHVGPNVQPIHPAYPPMDPSRPRLDVFGLPEVEELGCTDQANQSGHFTINTIAFTPSDHGGPDVLASVHMSFEFFCKKDNNNSVVVRGELRYDKAGFFPSVCRAEREVCTADDSCCSGNCAALPQGSNINGSSSGRCLAPGCSYVPVACIRAPCPPVVYCPPPTPTPDPCEACQAQGREYYCTEAGDPQRDYCSDSGDTGCEGGPFCEIVNGVQRCYPCDPVRFCRKCSLPSPTPTPTPTPTRTPTPTPRPNCPAVKGDVSCDGEVDLVDAVILVDALVGRTVFNNPQSEANADLDNNGIDIVDLIRLIDYLAGRIRTLGPSSPAPSPTPKTTAAPSHTIDFGGVFKNTYSPSTITVRAGSRVQWRGDFKMHPLQSDDGLWSNVESGSSFGYIFNTPGTYRYFCTTHGGPGGKGMSGTIVVLSRTAPTPQACTEDAKLCPDGSYVGRNVKDDCNFNPCPAPSPTPSSCPTPPACSGQLIPGEPDPNDPNHCVRYTCGSVRPTSCPTPPPCPGGQLLYNDPDPNDPNYCARYVCKRS